VSGPRAEDRPVAGAHAAIVVALLAVMAYAAPVGVARAQDISPDYRADVQALLHLTRADSLGMQMAGYMVDELLRNEYPGLSDSVSDRVRHEVGEVLREEMPAFMDLQVSVYARYYSAQELKDVIAFYRTPLGAKMIRTAPLVMHDTIAISKDWSEGLAPKITERIQRLHLPEPRRR